LNVFTNYLLGSPRIETGGAHNYSPMSYSGTVTPSSQWIFNQNSKEMCHYLELIKKALRRHSGDLRIGFSGGSLIISRGVQTVVQLRNVTEAVHLSNIYHVIKAMEFNLNDCFAFLQEFGIPTLVQATNTHKTPPFDQDDFRLDGLNL
jgi:hypothetical protein